MRPHVSDEQFRIAARKETNNSHFTLKVLTERAIDLKKDVFSCLIDSEKGSDRVKHDGLFNMLQTHGSDGKGLRLLISLYWNRKAAVIVSSEESL